MRTADKDCGLIDPSSGKQLIYEDLVADVADAVATMIAPPGPHTKRRLMRLFEREPWKVLDLAALVGRVLERVPTGHIVRYKRWVRRRERPVGYQTTEDIDR